MDSFGKAFGDFIKFFTVKRVVVLLVVSVVLLLILAPHQAPNTPPSDNVACDASCPLHPDVINIPQQTMITQENWTVTLVGDDWELNEPSIPEIKLSAFSAETNTLVLLIKEPTELTLPGYAISTIRVFLSDGATLQSAKQVLIGGQKFILVNMTRSFEIVWAWITVKDGIGYGLTCGSDLSELDAGSNIGQAVVSQQKICTDVAESLDIQ